MRHVFPRVRHGFVIVILNCILVPFSVRYFSCDFRTSYDTERTRRSSNSGYVKPDSLKANGKEEVKIVRRPSCTPKKNIVFLKTHKTGSSTITNILNRYGELHDLIFVLPRIGQNRLDWPWIFQMESFHPLNGSTPNILCNHARYNRKVMESLMPNDTLYITILRDPVTQFESTFSYMTLDKILGMDNTSDPLEEFFRNPQSVLVNYVLTQDLRINSDRLKLIRNGMFYDLGLESREFEDVAKIRGNIQNLDQEFDLVLITEYFEESIILMRRMLCWDLDDVVYFTLNERLGDTRRELSPSLRRKIQKWSYADVTLYNHFNRTFWKVLRQMGPDFWEEVKLLKVKNKIMKELCLDTGNFKQSLADTADLRRLKLKRNIPTVAREMCERMTHDEVKYLKYLRQLQDEKLLKKYRQSPVMKLLSPIKWLFSRLSL